MLLNFLTVSENGYFISFSNLSMAGGEGYEEGSQLETGLVSLEGECTGDRTPCRWQVWQEDVA